jgi:hypothetical protein
MLKKSGMTAQSSFDATIDFWLRGEVILAI